MEVVSNINELSDKADNLFNIDFKLDTAKVDIIVDRAKRIAQRNEEMSASLKERSEFFMNSESFFQ